MKPVNRLIKPDSHGRQFASRMAVTAIILSLLLAAVPVGAAVRVFETGEQIIANWCGSDDNARQVIFDRGNQGQGLPVSLSYDGKPAELNVAANVLEITRYHSWETSDVSYQARFNNWKYALSPDGKMAVVKSVSEIILPPEGKVYDPRIEPLDYTFKVTRWYTIFDEDDGFYYHQRIEPGGPLRPLRWQSVTRLTHLKDPVEDLKIASGCTEWYEADTQLSGTQIVLARPQQFETDYYGKTSYSFDINPGQQNGGFATHDVLHSPNRDLVYIRPIRYSGVHFVAGPDDLSKPEQTRGSRYYLALTAIDIQAEPGAGVERINVSSGIVGVDAKALPCRLTLSCSKLQPRIVLVWVKGFPRTAKTVSIVQDGETKMLLEEGMFDVWKSSENRDEAVFFTSVRGKTQLQLH
ncbi:MAG: hypothetical protein ABIG61_00395 [Planctomycetota bacterium]